MCLTPSWSSLYRQAKVAPALLVSLLCAGCATVERGTTDTLAIVSDPPGATATGTIGASCITPCSLEVGRRDDVSITIAKAGFVSRTVTVKTRISDVGVGFFMENVVTAGLGGGVDIATGATLEHAPNPVSVTLAPAVTPVSAKPKPGR